MPNGPFELYNLFRAACLLWAIVALVASIRRLWRREWSHLVTAGISGYLVLAYAYLLGEGTPTVPDGPYLTAAGNLMMLSAFIAYGMRR